MNNPQIFLKRTSTVEAWQWDGTPECADLIVNWIDQHDGFAHYIEEHNLIAMHETADVTPTDWVVRDKFGEFWPLGADIFPAVYASLL